MGQDKQFWDEWEKKYGKPPTAPTPEVVVAPTAPPPSGPPQVAPVEPVTYDPSQFSLGVAGPAGPAAPPPSGVSPGWEEWEQRFGKAAGAPVAQQPTQPVPSPAGQGGFLDWASRELNPFDLASWKEAGKDIVGPLWKGGKEAFNVLADIDTAFWKAAEYTALERPSGALGLLYAQERGLVTPEEAQQVRELRDEEIFGQLLGGAYGDWSDPGTYNTFRQELRKVQQAETFAESARSAAVSPATWLGIPVLDPILGKIIVGAVKGIWQGRKIPYLVRKHLFKIGVEDAPDITITPEELVVREAREKPGYVDTGEVDTVAEKVADLNARAGPGDAKFAYIDPETGSSGSHYSMKNWLTMRPGLAWESASSMTIRYSPLPTVLRSSKLQSKQPMSRSLPLP